jgi:hypothetical protein
MPSPHVGRPTLSVSERQTARRLLEWSEAFATAAFIAAGVLKVLGMPLRLFLYLAADVVRRGLRY